MTSIHNFVQNIVVNVEGRDVINLWAGRENDKTSILLFIKTKMYIVKEVVLNFSDNKYGENVIKMASLLTPKRKYLNYV
jgi:hypothetical protein